jgi:hypothetical protein
MSREAIEVGAFTWSRIQRLYDTDSVTIGSAANPKACSVRKRCSPSSFAHLDFRSSPGLAPKSNFWSHKSALTMPKNAPFARYLNDQDNQYLAVTYSKNPGE